MLSAGSDLDDDDDDAFDDAYGMASWIAQAKEQSQYLARFGDDEEPLNDLMEHFAPPSRLALLDRNDVEGSWRRVWVSTCDAAGQEFISRHGRR